MSYDLYLEINTGANDDWTSVSSWNYTSNCAPMWRKAGADLAEFDKQFAGDMAPVLQAAIERMKADPETYRAMNPRNGWGSYDHLLEALTALLELLQRHSKTTIRVWR